MIKKKLGVVLTVLFLFVVTLNSTLAVEIFDYKSSKNVYKLSEDKSEFNIPFSRFVDNRIEIDKSISQLGLFMSTSSIEVGQPLKGIQVFYSNDTVRLNSDTEYPVIFSTGNVIINGTIENTTFIYCNGTITVTEEANVKQNLICYTSKLELNGKIDGNVLGYANTLNINGSVNGKIKMNVLNINTTDNAKVEKGIDINTTNESLTIPESVGASKIDIISTSEKINVRQYILEIFLLTVGNLVMFLLILIFAKQEGLDKLSDRLQDGRRVIKNGIYSYIGLIMMICFGIVLLVLLTKLGVSLLIFAIAAMIIVTLLKNVIFGTFVTQLVARKYKDSNSKPNTVLTAIIVLLVLELIETIPYVGEFVKFVTFILSLGILVSVIFKEKNDNKTEEKQEIIEAK